MTIPPALRRYPVVPLLRGKPLKFIGLHVSRHLAASKFDREIRNYLVVAIPKSGSTWLHRMLCSIPGVVPWSPRCTSQRAIFWRVNGTLNMTDDLPAWWADRLPRGFTATKTHLTANKNNTEILDRAQRPFVLLVRDLRDIVVSFSYFIATDPNHPQYPEYAPLSVPERLDRVIETLLPSWCEWANGWMDFARQSNLIRLVRYEELLTDTETELVGILRHYRVPEAEAVAGPIARKHSFRAETGRAPGEADPSSFNRKAVAGDWREHLNEARKDRLKQIAQPTLEQLGYVSDRNW